MDTPLSCADCGEPIKPDDTCCRKCYRPLPETADAMELRYWEILPLLKEAARKGGWCLALHGSMRRDLDLIAVPWVEDAIPYDQMLIELGKSIGGGYLNGWRQDRPFGRVGFKVIDRSRIILDNGGYIDISVIDPRVPPAQGDEAGLNRVKHYEPIEASKTD